MISPQIDSAQSKQRSTPLHNDYYKGTRDATIEWTFLVVTSRKGHPSLMDDRERQRRCLTTITRSHTIPLYSYKLPLHTSPYFLIPPGRE